MLSAAVSPTPAPSDPSILPAPIVSLPSSSPFSSSRAISSYHQQQQQTQQRVSSHTAAAAAVTHSATSRDVRSTNHHQEATSNSSSLFMLSGVPTVTSFYTPPPAEPRNTNNNMATVTMNEPLSSFRQPPSSTQSSFFAQSNTTVLDHQQNQNSGAVVNYSNGISGGGERGYDAPSPSFVRGTTRPSTAEGAAASMGSFTTTHHQLSYQRLLDESQSQVRELLPYRENAVRLKTELEICKQMLKGKEDECERLHQTLQQDRQERQASVRKLQQEQHEKLTESGATVQRLEQELSMMQIDGISRGKDVERLQKQIKVLEQELQFAKQGKQEEQTRNAAKETQISNLQQELSKAVSQVEEAVRSQSKWDVQRITMERDVSELRRQLDQSRDELVQVKRDAQRQSVLLTAASAERDSAKDQVVALTNEVQELRLLRSTVEELQPVRSELVSLKAAFDASDAALSQERIARRSAESEVEQLHLRIRGVEADAQRLTTELHRAQCDAAERASLSDDVTQLQRVVTQLQYERADQQRQYSRLNEELERVRGEYDALYFAFKSTARKLSDALQEDGSRETHAPNSGMQWVLSQLLPAPPAQANFSSASSRAAEDDRLTEENEEEEEGEEDVGGGTTLLGSPISADVHKKKNPSATTHSHSQQIPNRSITSTTSTAHHDEADSAIVSARDALQQNVKSSSRIETAQRTTTKTNNNNNKNNATRNSNSSTTTTVENMRVNDAIHEVFRPLIRTLQQVQQDQTRQAETIRVLRTQLDAEHKRVISYESDLVKANRLANDAKIETLTKEGSVSELERATKDAHRLLDRWVRRHVEQLVLLASAVDVSVAPLAPYLPANSTAMAPLKGTSLVPNDLHPSSSFSPSASGTVVLSQADLLRALSLTTATTTNNNRGSSPLDGGNLTASLVAAFEAVLHRCRELQTQERYLTADRDRLHAELTQSSTLMRNQQIASVEELVATQDAARTASQAMRDAHSAQEERWNLEKRDLEQAVRTAVERLEGLTDEHSQLRAAYDTLRRQEAAAQEKLEDAKQLLETHHSDLRLVSTQLEALRSEHAEQNFEAHEAQQALRKEVEQNRQLVERLELQNKERQQIVEVGVLLARHVLGLRAAIKTLCLERHWALQWGQAMESSLQTLLQETTLTIQASRKQQTTATTTADGSAVSHDTSSVLSAGPSPTARGGHLLRRFRPSWNSLRPVVIALMAARRLQSLYWLRRQANPPPSPHATSSVYQNPGQTNGSSRSQSPLYFTTLRVHHTGGSSIPQLTRGTGGGADPSPSSSLVYHRKILLPPVEPISPQVFTHIAGQLQQRSSSSTEGAAEETTMMLNGSSHSGSSSVVGAENDIGGVVESTPQREAIILERILGLMHVDPRGGRTDNNDASRALSHTNTSSPLFQQHHSFATVHHTSSNRIIYHHQQTSHLNNNNSSVSSLSTGGLLLSSNQTARRVQSQIALLESEKLSFELFWGLAAGLSHSRNALKIGLTGETMRSAAALRQASRSVLDARSNAENAAQNYKLEIKGLHELLQMKDAELDETRSGLRTYQTREAQGELIEKARFLSMESRAVQSEMEWIQEKHKVSILEEHVASLQHREAELLSRQTELQNEAKSLAIEVSRKTAQLVSGTNSRPLEKEEESHRTNRHAEGESGRVNHRNPPPSQQFETDGARRNPFHVLRAEQQQQQQQQQYSTSSTVRPADPLSSQRVDDFMDVDRLPARRPSYPDEERNEHDAGTQEMRPTTPWGTVFRERSRSQSPPSGGGGGASQANPSSFSAPLLKPFHQQQQQQQQERGRVSPPRHSVLLHPSSTSTKNEGRNNYPPPPPTAAATSRTTGTKRSLSVDQQQQQQRHQGATVSSVAFGRSLSHSETTTATQQQLVMQTTRSGVTTTYGERVRSQTPSSRTQSAERRTSTPLGVRAATRSGRTSPLQHGSSSTVLSQTSTVSPTSRRSRSVARDGALEERHYQLARHSGGSVDAPQLPNDLLRMIRGLDEKITVALERR